jgi:putative transposase
MQPSKQNISKKNIEKEIYNTFELFKESKNITIVDFLNKLELTWLDQQNYRKIKYSFYSLYKLLIFKKLKGIKFQKQLERYLKKHKDERKKLGFESVPNQRTISYFLNNILDEETKDNIDFICQKINEISEKFGIILDIKLLTPEKQSIKSKRTFHHNKNLRTKEITQLFKKRFSSVIDLNTNNNCIYSKNDLINLLLHMCNTADFAENGSHILKINKGKIPDGDTLLYHLKNYEDISQIKRMFITMFEMIWESARKANHFPRTVDCSIDYTSWHFYGDKNAPMITEMKTDRGTTHCYKFATINISENNQRFTLLAIPVGPFDKKEEILKTLLDYAKQRVKIRRLYVDRGFFDSYSIALFKRYQIKFLMPCTANERIKKVLEIVPTPTVIKDYEMKNTLFNVVVVTDEYGIRRAFATNIDFNENDVGLTERLFYLYGKRWSIETSYRVKKHSFRPKTTSKNYFIRLFYFLFSTLLYNLWILADILICIALLGNFNGTHIITSKYFGNILLAIDHGG